MMQIEEVSRSWARIMADPRGACSVVFAGFCSVTIAGCQSPRVPCTISTQHFAASYSLERSEGSCDIIAREGVSAAYHPGPGGLGGLGDLENAGMSLIAAHVREIYNSAASAGAVDLELFSEYQSSFGKFEAAYPDDGICRPDSMTPVEFAHEGVAGREGDLEADEDESVAPLPANHVVAKWSDVSVWVSPDIIGTYLEGELTVTQRCGTVVYSVRAVPELRCLEDADCAFLGALDPDFDVACDPDLHISWKTKEADENGVYTYGACYLE